MSTKNSNFAGQEYDLDNYKLSGDDAPAVYISTYKKYNNGSLKGMWLDLTTFSSYEEFVDVCKFLHRDEQDPEFMTQDFSGFPRIMYFESGLMCEDSFDVIREVADMDDEDEREAAWSFIRWFGSGKITTKMIDQFHERYCGRWDSEKDFAEDLAVQCGYLDEMPEHLQSYFDYKAFAYDLFHGDYFYDDENGFVFRR